MHSTLLHSVPFHSIHIKISKHIINLVRIDNEFCIITMCITESNETYSNTQRSSTQISKPRELIATQQKKKIKIEQFKIALILH